MLLGQQTWHIVQTNDDLGEPTEDYRRPVEQRKLTSLQHEQVTPRWVLEEMRATPLYQDATIFSWVAVPRMNYYKLVLSTQEPEDVPGSDQLAVLTKLGVAH